MVDKHRVEFSEIRIENFKGFRDLQSARLGRITLIYGPNSSGKSALIQALLVMSQSVQQGFDRNGDEAPIAIFDGQLARLGSFQSAIHRHDLSQAMLLGFSTTTRYESQSATNESRMHQDCIIGWDPELGAAIVQSCTYRAEPDSIGDPTFVTIQRDEKYRMRLLADAAAEKLALHLSKDLAESGQAFREAGLPIEIQNALATLAAVPELEGTLERIRTELPVSLQEIVDILTSFEHRIAGLFPRGVSTDSVADESQGNAELRRRAANEWRKMVGRRLNVVLEPLLGNLRYIGPLREAPKRIYLDEVGSGNYVGQAGSRAPWLLAGNVDALRVVNAWFSAFEIPYIIEAERTEFGVHAHTGEVTVLSLTDRRTGAKVALADVGFGISQILPVLVQLGVSRAKTVIVEQPELHLHPRLQAELGDLIVEAVSDSGGRNQVIVETHSEHLLLRLQRRIRSGALAAADVSVVYVDVDADNGSYVQEIALDERGEFTRPWPNGFFPERLDELLAES